jgi:hypothetical protein
MAAVAPRIALVTCAELPELEDDDRLPIASLTALGMRVEPAVWDDPRIDWAGYDLAVVRSTWDYPARRKEFVAWAEGVPRLANAASIVAWNTDKRYLAELADAGVPVVPTSWIGPDDEWVPPNGGHWVIKPSISAGSKDTGRYDLADPDERSHAVEHVRRLQAAGRDIMIQPYLDAVDTDGETALLYTAGRFSHAVRKGPMLEGPDLGVAGLYKPESITARVPSEAELAVAEHVLSVLPRHLPTPLYARVDLIPGPDGGPLLIELELTEPSLFMGYADGAAERFAGAIAAAV